LFRDSGIIKIQDQPGIGKIPQKIQKFLAHKEKVQKKSGNNRVQTSFSLGLYPGILYLILEKQRVFFQRVLLPFKKFLP